MAQINAVLDITGNSARELENSVVELGKRFGTDFAEIQQGMITLGRAGVEGVEQLKKGTKGLAALSVITGDAMHYGASAISSMIAVYPKLAYQMDDL
jgi:TP901 family phage tail tape measure protein